MKKTLCEKTKKVNKNSDLELDAEFYFIYEKITSDGQKTANSIKYFAKIKDKNAYIARS